VVARTAGTPVPVGEHIAGRVGGRQASRSCQGHAVTPEYRLLMRPPPIPDYLRLRREAGLSPKTHEQAAAALPGSWAACHVVQDTRGEVVGMGRLLGDGGWYFHVVDMAVLPQHQRRGIGDAILDALLTRVRTLAPPAAYVNLLADPPGRRLYQRHGFVETAPHSIGMALSTSPPAAT
jgi:GNAT superfamily N-acetyltransferase